MSPVTIEIIVLFVVLAIEYVKYICRFKFGQTTINTMGIAQIALSIIGGLYWATYYFT